MAERAGIQSQSGIIQDFNKLIATQPAAWLLLGNAVSLKLAQDIRTGSPNTKILVRADASNWALDAAFTQNFIDNSLRNAEPFLRAGVIDFLLPPNESVVNNDVEARKLNDLMVMVAAAYKAAGHRTGAYCFPVGNPPLALWKYLVGGIVACDGWLFLHQYGAPTLQSDAADLSLRHRSVVNILKMPDLKIGILECGLDFGIGRLAPDGYPTSGGYRAIGQQGDSESFWIDNLTDQLTWWNGELAHDPAVKFWTLYGYEMNGDWSTFNVAAIDTDRRKFIDWLGTLPSTPAPIGDTVTDAQDRLSRAWKSINIPYNPVAAFPKIALALGLGRPVGIEYLNAVGKSGQGFERAFLESDAGDVLSAKAYDWLTGEPWVPAPVVVPPSGTKRLTTADMPAGSGFLVLPYMPKAGEKFFGLVEVSNYKNGPGNGTQTTVEAVNEQGSPTIGYRLTHAFDAANQKSETFPSPSVGFILSTGSYYTPPQIPNDHFYVSKGDGTNPGQWPTTIGDVALAGMPNGQHTEVTFVFELMVG